MSKLAGILLVCLSAYRQRAATAEHGKESSNQRTAAVHRHCLHAPMYGPSAWCCTQATQPLSCRLLWTAPRCTARRCAPAAPAPPPTCDGWRAGVRLPRLKFTSAIIFARKLGRPPPRAPAPLGPGGRGLGWRAGGEHAVRRRRAHAARAGDPSDATRASADQPRRFAHSLIVCGRLTWPPHSTTTWQPAARSAHSHSERAARTRT